MKSRKNTWILHFLSLLSLLSRQNGIRIYLYINVTVAHCVFRRGFTFAVALILNEKIKVERVAILMGHPVRIEEKYKIVTDIRYQIKLMKVNEVKKLSKPIKPTHFLKDLFTKKCAKRFFFLWYWNDFNFRFQFFFQICISGFIYGVEDHICEYYGYWTKQEIPFGENPFLNKFLSKNAISKYVGGLIWRQMFVVSKNDCHSMKGYQI